MRRSLRILLSVSSGILLSLAWLGFPGWTLFLAFVPLLFLDHYFVEHKVNFNSVSFFGHAFLAALIWNVSTTYWIINATLAGALMAFIVNSFLMALFLWLAHIARRKLNGNLGYAALTVFWISFEYFHYHWDIEWPWLQLGNGFANNIKWVQWYEFTGIFGGTLWVLLMNILLFKILVKTVGRVSAKNTIPQIVRAALFLLAPLVVSLFMYSGYEEETNPRNIVIVQPNIDPYEEKYGIEADNEKLAKLISLASTQADNNTDLIIAPETVFENRFYWNEEKLYDNNQYKKLSQFTTDLDRAEMIFGVVSSRIYPDRASATKTSRNYKDIYYDVFNSAFFIDNEGKSQIYHKSKLVVGVEKMPFMKYLGFLGDLVIDIGGTTGSFGRQTEPSNFTMKDGTKAAPVICYESIFGEYLSGYVKKGANLIVIITNDGWWKKTHGYKQHMSFARLRAIETRRSIARSANTGISCFINQRGDVFQPTEWWEDAVIKGNINVNNEITFYTRYGDFIARIALFLSVLLFLRMVLGKFMRR